MLFSFFQIPFSILLFSEAFNEPSGSNKFYLEKSYYIYLQ